VPNEVPVGRPTASATTSRLRESDVSASPRTRQPADAVADTRGERTFELVVAPQLTHTPAPTLQHDKRGSLSTRSRGKPQGRHRPR